jgi:hypothetical protein
MLLAFTTLRAQEGPFASSGMGFIYPEKGVREWTLNFPLAKIELFDGPSGKSVGSIIKKNSLNILYQINAKGFPYRVADKDLVELLPHGYCLKFFEIRDNFVKVLVNSTGRGYWISLKEMAYLRYKSMNWVTWMKSSKEVFYPMVDVGINLRSAPDQKSNKVELLKGNHYAITLSGNTEGSWAEASVSYYAVPPCKGNQKVAASKVMQGWIKVIDDAGMPNIWYYPQGCR